MDIEFYWYKARYRSNYDGDTLRVDVDLGMGIWRANIAVRLFGVDTPELRGGTPESKALAEKAKAFIADKIDGPLYLNTIRDEAGKYGRLLAVVHTVDGLNINQALLDEGLATLYKEKS